MYRQMISFFQDNPRQLFLMDAIGAILSAVLLGVVLTQLERLFGMPKDILYKLALVACSFAVYSYGCSRLVGANWKPFLFVIISANLLYCFATATCVYLFFDSLSWVGISYFILEILVILALVFIEIKVARRRVFPADDL